MVPDQLINRWNASTLAEGSAAQQHFLDVCSFLGESSPAEAEPTRDTFTFEKGVTTATGEHGWADIRKNDEAVQRQRWRVIARWGRCMAVPQFPPEPIGA